MSLVEVAENKLRSITAFNWMLAPRRLIRDLESVGTPQAVFLHVEGICLTRAFTARLSKRISSSTANISHHPLGKKNRNQVSLVIRLNGCRASALAGVFHLQKQFRCYDILAGFAFFVVGTCLILSSKLKQILLFHHIWHFKQWNESVPISTATSSQ